MLKSNFFIKNKTKKITKPFQRKNLVFYAFFKYIHRSWLFHSNYTYQLSGSNLWVCLINKRQEETCSLFGRKNEFHEINLFWQNECIPKITIVWIRLKYLTSVALLSSTFPFTQWYQGTFGIFHTIENPPKSKVMFWKLYYAM